MKPQHVDGRADLYSLGIIMYELLAGTLPFKAKSVHEVLHLQINAPVPDIPDITSDLIRRVVSKLLMKSPEDRYQSARELMETLNSLLSQLPESLLSLQPIALVSSPETRPRSPITQPIRSGLEVQPSSLLSQGPVMPAMRGLGAPAVPTASPDMQTAPSLLTWCQLCGAATSSEFLFCAQCRVRLDQLLDEITPPDPPEPIFPVPPSPRMHITPITTLRDDRAKPTIDLDLRKLAVSYALRRVWQRILPTARRLLWQSDYESMPWHRGSSDPVHSQFEFDRSQQPESHSIVGLLVIRHGRIDPDHFVIRKARTVIGRGVYSDIRLTNSYISSQHALLVYESASIGDACFVLYDLASVNGTYVNDRRIDRCEIQHNDVVTIGEIVMVFKRVDDAGDKATGALSAPEKIQSPKRNDDLW